GDTCSSNDPLAPYSTPQRLPLLQGADMSKPRIKPTSPGRHKPLVLQSQVHMSLCETSCRRLVVVYRYTPGRRNDSVDSSAYRHLLPHRCPPTRLHQPPTLQKCSPIPPPL